MADYIFNKVTVVKSQLYQKIKEILTTAGWVNVSSNPTTDFDVFQSTGEDGTKNLVLQMRQTNQSNTNPISSTNNGLMSVRLVGGYTPGANGVGGVFTKTPAWFAVPVFNDEAVIPPDRSSTLYYYCNKNFFAYLIDPPSNIYNRPCAGVLGLPDEYYCSEPESRGLIWAVCYHNRGGISLHATDTPGELTPLATASVDNITVYSNLPPRSPNAADKFTPTEVYYGNTTEGLRGKIPGFKFVTPSAVAPPSPTMLNGDTWQEGTKVYKVFNIIQAIYGYDYSAFPPSSWIVIRTA